MGFARINHIIPASLKLAGIPPTAVVESPREVFERLAGETLSDLPPESFRIVGFEQGTLTVSCRSSRAAYRLRAIQEDLLAGANRLKPASPIARMRLMISTWR